MLEKLSAVYVCWLEDQGLPRDAEANELLMSGVTSPAQRAWLNAFVTVWDGVEAIEGE